MPDDRKRPLDASWAPPAAQDRRPNGQRSPWAAISSIGLTTPHPEQNETQRVSEAKQTARREQRRRRRERQAARARAYDFAAQLAEDRGRLIEQLIADRIKLLQVNRCQYLTVEQEGDRLALIFADAAPPTSEAEQRQFLGHSLHAWAQASDELLSVFGLVDVAARWRSQLQDVGQLPPAALH